MPKNRTIGQSTTYLCRHDSLALADQLALGTPAVAIRAQLLVAAQSGNDAVIAASRTFRDARTGTVHRHRLHARALLDTGRAFQ